MHGFIVVSLFKVFLKRFVVLHLSTILFVTIQACFRWFEMWFRVFLMVWVFPPVFFCTLVHFFVLFEGFNLPLSLLLGIGLFFVTLSGCYTGDLQLP